MAWWKVIICFICGCGVILLAFSIAACILSSSISRLEEKELPKYTKERGGEKDGTETG